MTKTKMTPEAAVRIQSTAAKVGGGKVSKGSFAARALKAATKNSVSSKGKASWPSTTGKPSGKGRDNK